MTKKMQQGDEMHLTVLMAPYSLNLVCGNDRQNLLSYGRAAFDAGVKAAQGVPVPAVLDDRWKARMLDGRALVRDGMGFGDHPELPVLDEGMKPKQLFAALGIELKHTMAEDDLEMDVQEAMCEAGNWSGWKPQPPAGNGWQLVSIFDTEDGQAAWWMRELDAQAAQGMPAPTAHPAEGVQEVEHPNDEQACEYYVSNCESSAIQFHGPSYERGFLTGKVVGQDELAAEGAPAPVLYVSKGQMENHRDPDGPDSQSAGRYIPARLTPAGKFTTPLFAAPQAQAEDARDAAFEAVRKKFCKLQRYSFLLDGSGNVRRVPQFTGNWVEFESVHTLFDPVAVDAAITAQAAKGE